MNPLKKLVKDWKTEAHGPTLSMHKRVAEAYMRCATELESMLGAVEALSKFRKGNGCGLPFGTIAWVRHDSGNYIRQWHPMAPNADGVPRGNWWPLEAGVSGRFSEHEVTHYSVIEVPEAPDGYEPAVVPTRRVQPLNGVLTAVVGRVGTTYRAWTVLADLDREVMSDQGFERGLPVVVQFRADSEEEALGGLCERVRDVLDTFYEEYKVVRL